MKSYDLTIVGGSFAGLACAGAAAARGLMSSRAWKEILENKK